MKPHKKKILIADSDSHFLHLCKRARQSHPYQLFTAKDGGECLNKLSEHEPDLVIVDLMLPLIHGIEILKKIKTDPRTRHVGVIILSGYAMIQNYHVALRDGANYFLEKPFEINHLFELIKLFFLEELKPAPFVGIASSVIKKKDLYLPQINTSAPHIKFWGTRGSNPVSGPEYVRYGGNTPCLEVRSGQHLVIIDAGTGIRPLGNHLYGDGPQEIHLIFSHTHLDHINGFPFFSPIYQPETKLHIYAPIGYEKTTREIFTEMLAYSYFPVRLDDIQAKISFKDLQEGLPFQIGDIEINTHYAFHPGATLCFKIQCGKKLFGYATDNEFLMGYHGPPKAIGKTHPLLDPYHAQIQFFKGCDFLIHEAQYTPLEYQDKVGWGHSSLANAAVLIKHCDVAEWVITHHDPKHSDQDLLKKVQMQHDVLNAAKIECRVRMAFDGCTIPL
jgi:CheY-like chemotaxis protein